MGIQVILPQKGYEPLRRWERYKIDVPVRLIAQRPTKVAVVPGRGRELNRGGMAVFAGVELSTDELVAVEFTPPYAGQPIRVRGFVRNRNGYTYGIEFITENDSDYRNVGQLETILKTFGAAAN
ncbi:MAG: PilZ domain-containing protein [Acidobacteriia bacterium]|nr:PilZ domain-containing protein [Terriglobia bacterium]